MRHSLIYFCVFVGFLACEEINSHELWMDYFSNSRLNEVPGLDSLYTTNKSFQCFTQRIMKKESELNFQICSHIQVNTESMGILGGCDLHIPFHVTYSTSDSIYRYSYDKNNSSLQLKSAFINSHRGNNSEYFVLNKNDDTFGILFVLSGGAIHLKRIESIP